MCSAPSVYMFVYILIGAHIVPLKTVSMELLLADLLIHESACNLMYP